MRFLVCVFWVDLFTLGSIQTGVSGRAVVPLEDDLTDAELNAIPSETGSAVQRNDYRDVKIRSYRQETFPNEKTGYTYRTELPTGVSEMTGKSDISDQSGVVGDSQVPLLRGDLTRKSSFSDAMNNLFDSIGSNIAANVEQTANQIQNTMDVAQNNIDNAEHAVQLATANGNGMTIAVNPAGSTFGVASNGPGVVSYNVINDGMGNAVHVSTDGGQTVTYSTGPGLGGITSSTPDTGAFGVSSAVGGSDLPGGFISSTNSFGNGVQVSSDGMNNVVFSTGDGVTQGISSVGTGLQMPINGVNNVVFSSGTGAAVGTGVGAGMMSPMTDGVDNSVIFSPGIGVTPGAVIDTGMTSPGGDTALQIPPEGINSGIYPPGNGVGAGIMSPISNDVDTALQIPPNGVNNMIYSTGPGAGTGIVSSITNGVDDGSSMFTTGANSMGYSPEVAIGIGDDTNSGGLDYNTMLSLSSPYNNDYTNYADKYPSSANAFSQAQDYSQQYPGNQVFINSGFNPKYGSNDDSLSQHSYDDTEYPTDDYDPENGDYLSSISDDLSSIGSKISEYISSLVSGTTRDTKENKEKELSDVSMLGNGEDEAASSQAGSVMGTSQLGEKMIMVPKGVRHCKCKMHKGTSHAVAKREATEGKQESRPVEEGTRLRRKVSLKSLREDYQGDEGDDYGQGRGYADDGAESADYGQANDYGGAEGVSAQPQPTDNDETPGKTYASSQAQTMEDVNLGIQVQHMIIPDANKLVPLNTSKSTYTPLPGGGYNSSYEATIAQVGEDNTYQRVYQLYFQYTMYPNHNIAGSETLTLVNDQMNEDGVIGKASVYEFMWTPKGGWQHSELNTDLIGDGPNMIQDQTYLDKNGKFNQEVQIPASYFEHFQKLDQNKSQ